MHEDVCTKFWCFFFTVILFVMVYNYEQLRALQTTSKLQAIYAMEYYVAVNKDEDIIYRMTCRDVQHILHKGKKQTNNTH